MSSLSQGLSRVSVPLLIAVLCSTATSQVFEDVTIQAGLGGIPLDDSIYPDSVYGVGMCAFDFDRDGDLDLFVGGNQLNNPTPHRLFRNNGNLTFTDVTLTSGIDTNNVLRSAQAADVDNDGDLDLYLSNWKRRPQLYINDGQGHFVDEARNRGLLHRTAAWGATFADFDRDGWLDLYIGNRFSTPGTPQDNILYRNTGNGFFEDVTAAAMLSAAGAATFFGAWIDYNEDGYPDLCTINDKGSSYDGSRMFRNNGDGRFSDVSSQIDAYYEIDGMGFDYIDMFNDGGLDYYVSDLMPDHLLQVWDSNTNRYVNLTDQLGLRGGLVGWAVHFSDFDNDSWPDLHVVHMNGPNHLYRNPAAPVEALQPWPRATYPNAPSHVQMTAIVADFDNDGRMDILHRFLDLAILGAGLSPEGLMLQRNVSPVQHWVKVDTKGKVSNADGFGARVEVWANGQHQRQYRRHGVGIMSGNDIRVHFGCGDDAIVDRIKVTWPSGIVQEMRNVPADQIVEFVEPSMKLIGDPLIGRACIIDLKSPTDAGLNYAIVLAAREHPFTPLPDGRSLPIAIDALTALSIVPGNALIHGNVAALHRGGGGGLLTIPNNAGMVGMRLFATGFTFDQFGGIHTVFPKALRIDIH
ncbi:MAG: CRTAC1 family protein [Planctomycetes bacterium]|nr:CRTAC1 family protein [Planctomycetota bacterium]